MNRFHRVASVFLLCGVAAAFGQNLITNPGFESSGTGWNLWFDASASEAVATVTYPTSGAHSGTRFAQVAVTTPSTENWHIQFQPPGGWTAENGRTYDMTFWAKSEGSTSMHFSVQDGPSNGYAYRTGFQFQLSPDWTQYTFTYTSDVEGASALNFFLYVGSPVDTYGFDDFSLTAQPVGIAPGARKAGQAFLVRPEAGGLVLSLPEGVSGPVKAELLDMRGKSLATATGNAETSLRLARPALGGVYFVRASTRTHAWVRKVSVP